jgi:hypothetical protein
VSVYKEAVADAVSVGAYNTIEAANSQFDASMFRNTQNSLSEILRTDFA